MRKKKILAAKTTLGKDGTSKTDTGKNGTSNNSTG